MKLELLKAKIINALMLLAFWLVVVTIVGAILLGIYVEFMAKWRLAFGHF